MRSGSQATPTQAVLLDVEGTTTPLAFVTEVLFPYVRTHLRRHLAEHAASPEYAALVDQLRQEHESDRRDTGAVPPLVEAPRSEQISSTAGYVEWLMNRDRKSTALKALQGRIWEEGYRLGELVGAVYDDVPVAFERWRARGLRIAIFSSGSVLAQRLIFGHSSAGDLTRFVERYFDTNTGVKGASESYDRIAATLQLPSEAVVFISDVVRELDAARASGMQTRLSIRPGNAPVASEHGHPVIHSFGELDFDEASLADP